jgi:TonB family protein
VIRLAFALLAAASCGANADAGPPTQPLVVSPVAMSSAETEAPKQPAREDVPPAPIETRDAATIVDAPSASTVTLQNQRAIGAAAKAWALYLNGIHNRIHGPFADGFLASLDKLPASDPRNDPKLVVRVEIVIAADGSLSRLAVVRSSGIRAFDLGAVESVLRAAPMEKPDSSLRSSDGRVYFHWELHRDDVVACSTTNVHPYVLALGS